MNRLLMPVLLSHHTYVHLVAPEFAVSVEEFWRTRLTECRLLQPLGSHDAISRVRRTPRCDRRQIAQVVLYLLRVVAYVLDRGEVEGAVMASRSINETPCLQRAYRTSARYTDNTISVARRAVFGVEWNRTDAGRAREGEWWRVRA